MTTPMENELPTVSENTLPTFDKPAGEPKITMTEKAIEKTRAFQSANPDAADKALRVYIEGGGCSGFSYRFKLDEKRKDDFVFDESGVTFVVDPMSMQQLKGSVIDYLEDFTRSGFEVKNPNATATCGCGESFSV